jgi:hypothetical protein
MLAGAAKLLLGALESPSNRRQISVAPIMREFQHRWSSHQQCALHSLPEFPTVIPEILSLGFSETGFNGCPIPDAQ